MNKSVERHRILQYLFDDQLKNLGGYIRFVPGKEIADKFNISIERSYQQLNYLTNSGCLMNDERGYMTASFAIINDGVAKLHDKYFLREGWDRFWGFVQKPATFIVGVLSLFNLLFTIGTCNSTNAKIEHLEQRLQLLEGTPKS